MKESSEDIAPSLTESSRSHCGPGLALPSKRETLLAVVVLLEFTSKATGQAGILFLEDLVGKHKVAINLHGD